ncbi:MAG: AAA family ATPase [Deltaproteobacteria bacterium]|nr:AAA family ATPase [Deltaproteobacteria bacterium]
MPLLSNSFFMFGARGTGKSSLLKVLFSNEPQIRWIDLLDDSAARRFLLNPRLLETETANDLDEKSWIVIDEVQKVPALLDYVHRLIETKGIRFALTGSSARALARVS